MVRAFISTQARTSRGSVVHIITGKGKSSLGAPVLRPTVAAELRGVCSQFISEWGPDSGDGGFVVRLR